MKSILFVIYFLLLSCSKLEQAQPITYFGQIKPITDRSCLHCHDSGGVASYFDLTSFKSFKNNSKNISNWVRSKKMPPFSPESDDIHYINKEFLTDSDRELLLQFLEHPIKGEPMPLLKGNDKLGINSPNYINFKFGKGLKIPPRKFRYKCFFLKIDEKYENKFITELNIEDFSNNNNKYIHHAIIHLIKIKNQAEVDQYSDPISGCHLPSSNPILAIQPESGLRIKKGFNLVVHAHFDRTMDANNSMAQVPEDIEFQFGIEDEVKNELFNVSLQVPNDWIIIPYQNTMNFSVSNKGSELFEKNEDLKKLLEEKPNAEVSLSSFMFHMHFFGKRMSLERVRNNKALLVLRENTFDIFNHYLAIPDRPIKIKKDDLMSINCDYDNSENNPRVMFLNPEKKHIYGGFGSLNEMCYLFMTLKVLNPQEKSI